MADLSDIGDIAYSGDEYTEDPNYEKALLHSISMAEPGSEGGAGVISEVDTTVSPGASPNKIPSVTPSPRPLVRKKAATGVKQGYDSTVGALKVPMLQE